MMANHVELFSNREWRLQNLYWIVDKSGQKVKFKLNWAQKEFLDDMWYCNVVLKCRQLGISTLVAILYLDTCLFNPNVNAGIIAHTREDAKQLFKKVKFSYDNLPSALKTAITSDTDTANEMKFSNGSSIRTGTSMRSSSLQYLHISEFGKICRQYPSKAEEIITGSLETVGVGQYVIIESTAEGKSGYFYDMCQKAMHQKTLGTKLSKLEYRFHFYPWWKELSYQIPDTTFVSSEYDEYFKSLGISLLDSQKAWYIKKAEILGDSIYREYPSSPEEAFKSSVDGLYYGKQMMRIYGEKRICAVPWEESLEVHTAWDLGFDDCTAIWFFQVVGKEIHLIDYFQASGEPLTYYLKMVKEKPYMYGRHFVPHDAQVREYSTGLTRIESAQKVGVALTPVPRLSIHEGIDAVRNMLGKCFFDEQKCAKGLKCLESYTKEWNASLGAYSDSPRHDEHCFIAGTLISTEGGEKPIEKIEVGDKVLTPNGYKLVNNIYKYKTDSLVTVSIGDRSITCTPHHQIFTAKGLVSADALRYTDEMLLLEDYELCKKIGFRGRANGLGFKDYILSMNQKQLFFLMDQNINCQMMDTIEAVHIISIETFTNIIMERYQKTIMSITMTGIKKITLYQICRAFLRLSIFECICYQKREKNYREKVLGRQLRLQKTGIGPKKGKNGILSMEKKYFQSKEITLKNVCIVKNLMNPIKNLENTVPTIASLQIEGLLEKTLSRENVKFVGRNLAAINIAKSERVRPVVHRKSVIEEEVWDLTVEDDHCYYANGILVSNSHGSDAFRYLCLGVSCLLTRGYMTEADATRMERMYR